MIPRKEALKNYGDQFLHNLKSAAQTQIEKIQTTFEGPDSPGRSERYFAALDRTEKRKFLIDEIMQASQVLTELSFDFENALEFYNTASDNELKDHILHIVFPETARKEDSRQKNQRIKKERALGQIEKPNPFTKTGASQQWRRRVMIAIDILLSERKQIAKIEQSWNDPSSQLRDAFRDRVLYGHTMKGTPDVLFTPFAMIIALDDNDYNEVGIKLSDNKIDNKNVALESFGIALAQHSKLTLLDGRIIFIRKPNQTNKDMFDKMLRHELFHLYFYNFIRKPKLSKVDKLSHITKKIQSVENAHTQTHHLAAELESLILEETAAYLFNTRNITHTDNAYGFLWESHITSIYENLSGEDQREALLEARKMQAQYLKKARKFQSSYLLLYEFMSKENESKDPKLSPEELKRNMLFFLSQWGPQRMDQLLERIHPDFVAEQALRLAKDDPLYLTLTPNEQAELVKKYMPQASELPEMVLRQDLQEKSVQLLKNLNEKRLNPTTVSLLNEVIKESNWLYAQDDLLTFLKLCPKLILLTKSAAQHHQIIRAVENTIVVREQKLSDKEIKALQELISLTKNHDDERLKRDSQVLERYLYEYTFL